MISASIEIYKKEVTRNYNTNIDLNDIHYNAERIIKNIIEVSRNIPAFYTYIVDVLKTGGNAVKKGFSQKIEKPTEIAKELENCVNNNDLESAYHIFVSLGAKRHIVYKASKNAVIKRYPYASSKLNELFDIYKQKVLNTLCNSCLPMAINIADKFSNKNGISFEECICSANIGVVEAAHRFDFNSGTKFTTYASIWIHKYLKTTFVSEKIPVKVSASFMGSDNYSSFVENIRKSFSLDKEDVQADSVYNSYNINTKTPEDEFVNFESHKNLNLAMKTLTSKEYYVISQLQGFHGKPVSRRKLCKELGITWFMLDKLEKKAFKKIKNFLNN